MRATRGSPDHSSEYQRLLHTLTIIIDRVQECDMPVSLLAAFGSVARLTPHKGSDTDLLVLFSGSPDYASELEQTTELLRIIRRAEEETVDEQYRWPIMPIPGDEAASDLDPDFIATIGREGVLLYHRPGTLLPQPLARLESFNSWARRVNARLRRHAGAPAATATPKRPLARP